MFTDCWENVSIKILKEISNLQENNTMIISLGNCFGNNITKFIAYNTRCRVEIPWEVLYNPFIIEEELERVVNPNRENIILEEYIDDKIYYIDSIRSWNKFTNKKDLKNYNKNFTIKLRELLQKSNIFLISLGLSEIYCLENGKLVNCCLKNGTNIVNSYMANIDAIEKSIENIVKKLDLLSNNPIIILMDSIIPIKHTASSKPIRIANNISIYTTYLATQNFLDKNRSNNIYYFPGFEIVQEMLEKQINVFQNDGRHLNADVIVYIGQKLREFLGWYPINPDDFFIKDHNNAGKYIGNNYYNKEIQL